MRPVRPRAGEKVALETKRRGKMRSDSEIFEITSENLTALILDYYDSVNCAKRLNDDLGQYDKYKVSNKRTLAANPFLVELIENDKYGDKVGDVFRFKLDNKSFSDGHIRCLYFDSNKRLVAFKEHDSSFRKPDKLYDIEKFEYCGSIRYGRCEHKCLSFILNGGFTYYRYDHGNIKEILHVAGGFGGFGCGGVSELRLPKELNAIHTVFDGSDERIILSKTKYILKLITKQKEYRIKEQYDMLAPPEFEPVKKRVIDTQKRLSKTLAKRITSETTLDQAVNAFFEVVSQAKPNEEAMLLFEVGYNSGENDSCSVGLLRQTPTREDEYYQMHMELVFEGGELDASFEESEWREYGEDDLKEYILQSKAYKALMKKKPIRYEVWADET